MTAPQPSRRQGPLRVIALTAAATAVMFLLSALALVIYTRDARDPVTHTLVIPAGSNSLINAGENPLAIPPSWSFFADDTLLLENQDRVAHRIGQWVVPAGSALSIELQPALGGAFLCSLHPSGEIAINVEPRDFDWRTAAVPALILGPAVGLVLVGVRWVMRLLDEPKDPAGARAPAARLTESEQSAAERGEDLLRTR